MFEAQQRFGFAITFLLFHERAQGEATMMPDDGRRAERDLTTGLLDAPAEINVIARFMVFGIESADVFKPPAVPRHVTPRDVLGDCVGKQHMARASRRCCDTSLHPVLRRRRDIWAANTGKIPSQQRAY